MATLWLFCCPLQTRSGGWEGTAILSTMEDKAKKKTTTPDAELAQKETEYNEASSSERFVEKNFQASTQGVERVRRELKDDEEKLARLAQSGFRPKEDVEKCLEDLRALRSAVHGAGAAASGSGQQPTPKEEDAESFKHKIEQLNLSVKEAKNRLKFRSCRLAWTGWSQRPDCCSKVEPQPMSRMTISVF